jgi:hypothetical protein
MADHGPEVGRAITEALLSSPRMVDGSSTGVQTQHRKAVTVLVTVGAPTETEVGRYRAA